MTKYLTFVLINLLALTIGLIVFHKYGKIEVLAAIMATGISLSLGLQKSKIENDIIFKQLFVEFNRRYDRLFNEKLRDIVNKQNADKNATLTEEESNLIIDYLNLCSEEYLWKTLHRIPNKVWIAWKNGMIYYLNQPIINPLVLKEKAQKNSYYGLFEELNNKIKNN